jgi:hypothetical protein
MNCALCGCSHKSGGSCNKARKKFNVKFDKGFRSLEKIKKKKYGTGKLRKIDTKKAGKYGNVI